jgi:ZIP family zinc transporter
MRVIFLTLGGVGFIFLMTCLGAASVLFLRKPIGDKAQKIFLGFAAGVMIAASVWSLLLPSIAQAKADGQIGWVPAACGFALGVLFLLGLDRLIPHLHPISGVREGPPGKTKRGTLLFLAVTLHNIPEGMAVGLSFALAARQGGDKDAFAAATALALGIGIQNFPEGAAISLPLRQEGVSRRKAFLQGCFSGAVEPVFGLLTALLAGFALPLMPWLLAFAAGAMMYVSAEELIPEANLGEHANAGTLGVMGGFLLMMILDVALG